MSKSEFEHDDFVSVLDRIILLCNQYDIPCGNHVVQPNLEILGKRISEGYRFLAYSLDSVFIHNSVNNPLVQ